MTIAATASCSGAKSNVSLWRSPIGPGSRLAVRAPRVEPGSDKWLVVDADETSLMCATGPGGVALPAGAALLASYEWGSTAVEVESVVLEALPGALRISWPGPRDQRRFARVSCQLPVRFATAYGVFDATAVNVGVGGMRIVTNEPLIPGAQVVAEITLEAGVVSAVARICSRESVDAALYSMRAQFTTISELHAALLDAFVASEAVFLQ